METLANAVVGQAYEIKQVQTDDEELKGFLFTLGCFEGQSVTVVSHLDKNFVISVKDARYTIDDMLADVIII